MNYSQIIRRYLADSKVSVDELAQKADVHRTTIYRALKGKDVNFKNLEAILAQAGYKVDVFPTSPPIPDPAPAMLEADA